MRNDWLLFTKNDKAMNYRTNQQREQTINY